MRYIKNGKTLAQWVRVNNGCTKKRTGCTTFILLPAFMSIGAISFRLSSGRKRFSGMLSSASSSEVQTGIRCFLAFPEPEHSPFKLVSVECS